MVKPKETFFSPIGLYISYNLTILYLTFYFTFIVNITLHFFILTNISVFLHFVIFIIDWK